MKTILILIILSGIGCATGKTSILPYKDTKAKADEWVLIKTTF